MNDEVRARLERAKAHPAYRSAMSREPDTFWGPALGIGLFYLLIPILFIVPFVLILDAELSVGLVLSMSGGYLIWAIPFLVVAARMFALRGLPVARWLGVIAADKPTRSPGHWIRLERLDAEPIDLRLRMKAYVESTGGAVATGTVGVAMCKGDQLVEWVVIPDTVADAPPAPTSPQV